MKHITPSHWISHFLASDPPRSKSLVMTIFGDSVDPHGGAIWLGSLIELLAPFGVNDRLLRTSVFRLAQEGWLTANRDGRRSAYSIAPGAKQRLGRAYRRIYAPLEVHWKGSWTLVITGNGSLDAAERGALRKELLWEGYSLISPGVFGHPAGDVESLEAALERVGVLGKLFVCGASELPGAGSRPMRALIDEGWDLREVMAGYERFLAQFAPLLDALDRAPALAPEQAFVIRTLLIHAYRRVQLHDPQLPVELLPEPWPGAQAYELGRALYRATAGAAEAHILATLRKEDPAAPEADAGFHRRFGGLG